MWLPRPPRPVWLAELASGLMGRLGTGMPRLVYSVKQGAQAPPSPSRPRHGLFHRDVTGCNGPAFCVRNN